MIPGASSPSWRKLSWGGGIPGGVSEGESGRGRPSPSPGFWHRAQPGLFSFAYICIYASFTCALGQGPGERHLCRGTEGNQSGWVPAGAAKLEFWGTVHPPIKCLNLWTMASSPDSCGCPGQELQSHSCVSPLAVQSPGRGEFLLEPATL